MTPWPIRVACAVILLGFLVGFLWGVIRPDITGRLTCGIGRGSVGVLMAMGALLLVSLAWVVVLG